jgi:hypothetical protein
MTEISHHRLVVMDNVPTRIVARDFNPTMATVYWFFIFNQVPDLPLRIRDLEFRARSLGASLNPLADRYRIPLEAA